VQSEYTYEPFGAATEAGTDANPFQYTGRENDGTGLSYYRARYYHPGLQRFVSEDPIGFRGGDTNLYAYVLNSPTGFRDTRGLIRESTIQAPRPSASPPPPPPTYPFPIGTVVLGGQGSAIGGPGGVVGSFAFAFNVELCQDGLNIRPGILLTGGTGAGLGVGAGGFLGYIEGPPENTLGPFVNFNGGVPAGGLTTVGGTVYTSITGHILGGAGQFGVGVPPVSGTITVEYTTGYFFGSPCRSQSKSSQ
jgi:RHS repeat-associated protein